MWWNMASGIRSSLTAKVTLMVLLGTACVLAVVLLVQPNLFSRHHIGGCRSQRLAFGSAESC